MQKMSNILNNTASVAKELRRVKEQKQQQGIKLRRAIEELEAIRKLGKAIRSVLNVDDLARIVVRVVTNELRGDIGSIMFIDKKKNELTILASVGIPARRKNRYRLKIGEGLAGWCVRNKKPVISHDMEKDPRFKRTSKRSYRGREFICAPFISQGKVIGVFNIEKPQGGEPYKKDDLELLCTFVDETVASFENAFLFEELQKAYYETIKALVIAMESKDPYMHGHGERVARYAVRIAKALNLPQEEIKLINFFSILHDIGKIGVPEEVLLKPGKLNAREWELVRKHPAIGESIIEPIEFLQPVRTLLRHHHEWYNGRGYPDNLRDGQIAVAARILAVADAFDAMQSDRPYRKAFSMEKAIQEIKKASGTQFDPMVVKALINVFEKS